MVLKQQTLVNLGEWQAISSSLREQNPKTDMASLAEQAYNQVVGSI
jgi:hypothetical protein